MISVLKDEGRYRMWYNTFSNDSGRHGDLKARSRYRVCYAESDDGIRWHKPEFHLFEQAGTQANNIVFRGVISHNLTPFLDDHPNCVEDKR